MNSNSNCTIFKEAVGREGSWATPCDGCCGVPSVVYCHADSAYLCASCDVRIHTANRVASRHERVRLSEAYKHEPAVLECRPGTAASCAAYEAQVHYANLLAGMHQCVPVMLHPVTAIPPAPLLAETAVTTTILGCKEEEASWLLLSKNSANHNCSGNSSSSSTYFGEVDEYFDLVGYNSYYDSYMNNNREQYVMQEQQHLQQMQKEYAEKEGSECVVPSQFATASKPQQSGYALVGAEQSASMTAGVSVYTDSVNNSISFSSMEGGIVPDNTVVDLPHSIIPTPAGASSLHSGPPLQMPLHSSSMDREARVLRYKEKKKTRTFEKTTRYATRKAYAEARPRIKGRFAKISEAEMEVDQMFSAAALSDSSYSTVPWF
uniref:CONSTANS n=1 Tax=Festuca arundinacea TaxID=4606 RepID=D2KI57_FESAR|nr:CONSTANS [Lolium arundinaceum]